ncbi:MAG: hypothetical protein J5711_04620 [Bacteroidales bacterium]|nr:hypothetical protein [Bacteroidales bacterium]
MTFVERGGKEKTKPLIPYEQIIQTTDIFSCICSVLLGITSCRKSFCAIPTDMSQSEKKVSLMHNASNSNNSVDGFFKYRMLSLELVHMK